ncbi:hypothetical protein ACFLRB_04660 [Acidobacteriota bacterium]
MRSSFSAYCAGGRPGSSRRGLGNQCGSADKSVFKGKAVDNLTRADFKLYENGKLQEINGFYLDRKKINIPLYELKAKKGKEVFPPRYFVLVFNLIDYNSKFVAGLDYVFDKILRKSDRVLFMINKEMFFYDDLSEKEKIRGRVKELLNEKGKISRFRMNTLLRRIESRLSRFKTDLKMAGAEKVSDGSNIVKPFLRDYYLTWRLFKKMNLMPTIDEFYDFAAHLESIKQEKWVINFYQVVRYPQFRNTSKVLKDFIKLLDSREYHKMNFDMRAETEFPAEEVSKLFYKVNVTFHSILIPTEKGVVSQDLEMKDISTAMENCLREITEKTGGKLVTSANLETALNTISEEEDICYMLTYEPAHPEKIGKIKIAVTGKQGDYKVVYDKNMRASYIQDYLARREAENPDIKIKELVFKGKKLSLRISDFLLKEEKKGKKSTGRINVHVRVEDMKGKNLFDKSRTLNPGGNITSVSIDFAELNRGEYYILVDARDEFTGNADLEFIRAEIGTKKTTLARVEFKDEEEEEVAVDQEKLTGYLSGAAVYCERLKRAAFHFYCNEKVKLVFDLSDMNIRADKVLTERGRHDYRNQVDSVTWGKKEVKTYFFDYQILSKKGKVTEQRKPVSASGKEKINEKNFTNKIVYFLTERAVFGPVTLLSKERQGNFDYKLIKIEKYKKRRFAVIEAIPKNKNVHFPYGKAWIDTEDYSVKKIKVDPRSIGGYEKLLPLSRQLQARLVLSCEVEYGQILNGLRFPTRVEISETYKGGPIVLRTKGYQGWERSKTVFTYDDYKFFDVEMSVTNE